MNEKRKYQKKENINLHGKVPPQTIEIEEVILGAIMIEDKAIYQVINLLQPEMFYKEAHQSIFTAIKNLFNRSDPVDMLTVANELKSIGKLDDVGGPYFITQLTNKVASATHINYHVRIVIQKYLQRELITISSETIRKAYDDTSDVFNLMDELLIEYEKIYEIINKSKTITSKDIFSQTIDNITTDKGTNNFFKLYTEDSNLDERFTLQSNDQLLLAAKSGAGKTSFLVWLIKRYLNKYPDILSVNWFCMEDSLQDIVIHMLAGDVLKTNEEIKSRKLSPEEIDIISSKKIEYDQYDIEFHDQPTRIDDIYTSHISFCKKRPNRFNLLIVDNVMTLLDNDQQNQNKADDYISRRLIKIRKNCDAISNSATIVLHHYNDEQLKKENLKIAYRPIEKDIRGSTRYRDCSTIVLLMNNPENYPDLLDEYKNEKELIKSLMLYDITKNRLGKTSSFRALKSLEFKLFKFTENE